MRVLIVLASVVAVGMCMPGGWSDQDISNPKYNTILMKLQNSSLISAMDGSATLIKVQTQVVAGMNYNFTLQIGNTMCNIVYFEQSWTNTHTITSDSCKANKREIIAGGYTVQDASDPMYMAMLTKLANKNLISLPQNSNSMVLVGVKSQVVSGMNYEFTLMINGHECKIVYYEVSWMKTHNITSDTCSTLSQKRQLAGGWSPVTNTLDEGVQSCLGASLDSINMMSNSMVRLVDSQILSAEQQVVRGIKYRFKLELSPSTCGKTDATIGETSARCPVDANSIMTKSTWEGSCVYAAWENPKASVAEPFTMAKLDADDTTGNSKTGILLGGDGHDQISHGKGLLGGDTHDLVDHAKNPLGGDTHDLVDHAKNLLGGDTHDLVDHAKNLLGGDTHDLIKHGKVLLGGDNHDKIQHGEKLLGGDAHDLVQHATRHLIGQDGHDNRSQGTKIVDGQDYHIDMFKEFKKNHNKLYGSEEEESKRYKIFCDNLRRAKKFQEIERGTARYGVTKFADLTKREFRQYVGKKWDINAMKGMKRADIPKGPIPESFDWREHGAVTPVKNQGSCGSCWAFSTTGNIEGQWAIKKKKLISLSEQELVDCDKVDEGCNGGLPSNAYKEIERLGGLETESEYSYKGDDEKCAFKKRDVRVYINDSVSISSNETEMASWLAVNGPISIGINAFAMQYYMGGISHPWSIFCNPSELDHGVLIVGYGVQGSKPYWIVKNSWGPDWGEKGYYLVYRGAGVCGLNTMCTSSVVSN